MMTLREVAQWLRVNPATVYRMVRREQIPAFRFGRNFRFRRSEIEAGIQHSRASVAEDRRYARPARRPKPRVDPSAQDNDAWISG